jgi:Arc/MetJ-type ribon-helix-helix transcriptional regulator
MIYHTSMPKSKVAVTVDSKILEQIDQMIRSKRFPNRSQAVEVALAEKLERLKRTRLAAECAKLDVNEEKALAEEGLVSDAAEWPDY